MGIIKFSLIASLLRVEQFLFRLEKKLERLLAEVLSI